MKFINTPIFIISLAIGLFLTYISSPPPDVIVVYPTPDNVDQLLYKDRNNTCYRYTANPIECPKNSSEIHEMPAQ